MNKNVQKRIIHNIKKIHPFLIVMGAIVFFLFILVTAYAITGENYLQMFIDWLGGI